MYNLVLYILPLQFCLSIWPCGRHIYNYEKHKIQKSFFLNQIFKNIKWNAPQRAETKFLPAGFHFVLVIFI